MGTSGGISTTEIMSLDNETNVSACWQYSQDQFKTISTVRAATGPITIALGSLAILFNVLYKKYLFQFHLMVLYMSVGAVLRGITASLSRVDYDVQNEATAATCVAVGFVDTYALWIIVLSTVSLGYSIYADFSLSRSSAYGGRQRQRCIWLSLIFVFPLFLLWIPFLKTAYGRSPNFPWCAIRTMDDNCDTFAFGLAISNVSSVAILLLSFIVTLLYAATAVMFIRRQKRWNLDPDTAKTNRKLRWSFLAFLLPLFAFITALVLGGLNVIVVDQSEYDYPLGIIDAAYNPTAIVAFLLTVHRELCRRSLSGRFTFKSKVQQYKVMSVELDDLDCDYHEA